MSPDFIANVANSVTESVKTSLVNHFKKYLITFPECATQKQQESLLANNTLVGAMIDDLRTLKLTFSLDEQQQLVMQSHVRVDVVQGPLTPPPPKDAKEPAPAPEEAKPEKTAAVEEEVDLENDGMPKVINGD
jgi:hypothetical protein